MFANHNCIIHHDPQRDDQREKRDHVDRNAYRIHQRNRSQHRHRNTKGDPESGARIQKQEQQPHDQHQTGQAVIQQYVQTRLDQLCPPVRQRNRHTIGKRGRQLLCDLFNRLLHPNRITLG